MGLFDLFQSSSKSNGQNAGRIQPEPDVTQLIEQGHEHESIGRFDLALQCYRDAIHLAPSSARAHLNLGNALLAQDNLPAALSAFHAAIELKPDYAGAYFNLGNALLGSGKFQDAAGHYRKALEIEPEYADVHCALGIALKELGQFDASLQSYQHALKINPQFAEAHYNQGVVYQSLHNIDAAMASFRRAFELNPQFTHAQQAFNDALQAKQQAVINYNRGVNLQHEGRLRDAIDCYRQALQIDHRLPEAHNNLGLLLLELGQHDDAIASFRAALDCSHDFSDARTNLLLAMNYTSTTSIEDYLKEAREFGRLATSRVRAPYTAWICSNPFERLRVGIVSGDLRTHSVGFFLQGLLSHIDPARIELFAYSTNAKTDALTDRIQPYFSSWRVIAGMSDDVAAQAIHTDGVHLLLDISGHTAHNRLSLFAYRPAPVQVTWLGLPATSGINEMDYILGDLVAIPVEHEKHFSENVWRLPDSYLCFSAPDLPLDVAALPALSNGYVTFGSFNNMTKMNDAVIALWSRVLHAVPDSRLYLKTAQLGDAEMRDTLLQRFVAHGIVPDRLMLAGSMGALADHLSEYNRIDIALDTFPYPGVTTSVEALWMGVPVLTMHGDRFLSLSAKTIAVHAGLGEWVASNADDYVSKAVAFSSDLNRLSKLRDGLRHQVLASAVFDTERFARYFEQALWEMYFSKNPS